jgi:TonB family protein
MYMVKAAIYLIAFYLVYSLMLSRDTSYVRNRVFILLSLGLSLVFPLITFQTIRPFNIQFFGKFLSDVFITATSKGQGSLAAKSGAAVSLQFIYSVYAAGVIIIILKLMADLTNLVFLIVRQKNQGSRIIRFHGFNTAGFSAMGYVFINTRLSPEEAGEIIRHEQNHLERNHFFDIVFIEIIKALQWFNPVVYLFNRSLRAIHEYQADQGCLRSGVPMVNYQSLLISQVFKSGAFNLSNSFSNPSLIRKRMIMMTKKPTSSFANVKLFVVIPVVGLVFLAISAYKEIPSGAYNPVISAILPDIETPVTTPVTVKEISYSSSGSEKTSKVPVSQAGGSEILPPPPPPPPPPSTDSRDEIKVVREEVSEDASSSPFVVVEEMPMFPGGDRELLTFIAKNTVYPEVAKENNIQGRVIIRFCITAKGGISRVSVIKGVDPDLDNEAIRVVNLLPEFKPGKQGGKPVPVWYMVPITFTLK